MGKPERRQTMKTKEKKELDNRKFLYLLGFFAAAFVLLLRLSDGLSAFLGSLLLPCLFHSLTGLYCPGCGGTRSVELLLNGRILDSFRFHPIVPYFALLYLWFMVSTTAEYLSKGTWKVGLKPHRWQLYGALALTVGNFLVKNLALVFFGCDLLGGL